MKPTTRQEVRALCDIIREEMAVRYEASSCIASARIGQEVLRYFGVDAKPVVATAHCYNAPCVKALREDRSPTAEEGARSVHVGDPEAQGRGWSGHLVLVTDEWLLDISIDQADRPMGAGGLEGELRISGPIVAPRQTFPAGPTGVEFPDTGVLVIWEPRPGERGYETAPDWRKVNRQRPIVGRIIRRYREETIACGTS